MRLLIATVSFVAMAGVAFAGQPQKTTTAQQTVVASAQKAPAKMTDQQLDKIVAGDNGNNTAVCITNRNGFNHGAASLKGGGGQGSGAAQFVIGPC